MTKATTMPHDEDQSVLLEVSQKAIIYDPIAKKFLLVKYAPPFLIDGQEVWSFVGGRIDKNEGQIDSLRREIREEAGEIDFEIIGVVDTQLGQRLRIGYLVLYKGGEVALSEEHTEYAWMTEQEIGERKDILPEIHQFIKASSERLKERGYLMDVQRLQADFENYKKRQATREKEIAGYLIEKLVMDLVPVMDNFRMATEHVPEAERSSPWVTGIQYIEKQLEKVLTENGVSTIEVKAGDAFDPTQHEALEQAAPSETDTEGEAASDNALIITKVLQNGFKIGERIIRPAKVTVK